MRPHQVHELLEINEGLRHRVAALEGERTRLKKERTGLHQQVLSLCDRVDHLSERRQELERQLSAAEEESHRFSERYVEAQQQSNDLAGLYVASYRLHETSGREEVLTALEEIIINLVGSEEFVILERSAPAGELTVATAYGCEPNRLGKLDLRSSPIGETARTGEMYLADGEGADVEPELVACIPMNLGNRVHGVIAIFRLLDHKQGLETLDYELFDLLASHAATSLCVESAVEPVATEVGAGG